MLNVNCVFMGWQESRRDRMWGMTGQVSNPASLFRLYVDYGRFTEATNLLLEYMEAFASVVSGNLFHPTSRLTLLRTEIWVVTLLDLKRCLLELLQFQIDVCYVLCGH